MKLHILLATFTPVFLSSLIFNPTQALAVDKLEKFEFELNGGLRVDQLDWNIAGNIDGNNPDILSELTWDDLEIYEYNTRGKVMMSNRHWPFWGAIKSSLTYGEIQSGDNQDSDYEFDDRAGEWSRSNNKSDNGDVWDVSLGGGLIFRSKSGKFLFGPFIGYSYHEQNLTIHDGYQTISGPNPFSTDADKQPPPVGQIAGLNSTYETEWRSGWVGVDLEYSPNTSFTLKGSVELHGGEYNAKGNWNLRTDLRHPISFRHYSDDVYGSTINFGIRAGVKNVLFNIDLNYQKWLAEDGEDRVYGSGGLIGLTRLNEVNWESSSVTGGVTVRF